MAEEDKQYKYSGEAVKILDSEKRTIAGWASTNALDRYNEIVEPSAFKKSLKKFMSNPVGYIGHNWQGLPAWKITKAQIKDKGLWVEGFISETAEDVWTLIKEGILKTLSIGFRLIKSEFDEDKKIRTITDLELLEVSIVGIPANPEALIEQAKAKGLDITNFKNLVPHEADTGEEDEMENQEILDRIDTLSKKIEDTPKAMTVEEAKKALAEIHKAVDDLKASGELTDEKLKEIQEKASADLIVAMNTLVKTIEQKWVTPPKMIHEMNSVGQAQRLGALKDLNKPEVFKKALIETHNPEKTAARIGMLDSKHLFEELQNAHDDLMIVGAYFGMVKDDRRGGVKWVGDPTGLKTYQRYKEILQIVGKALDTETSGEGADWLPTLMSGVLQESLLLERTLGRKLPRFNQPAKSFVWPLLTSGATSYIVAEATDDSSAVTFTGSTPGTSSITFTAKGVGSMILTSDEEIEDSIIAILPFIRTELAKAQADAEENALINGDNSTTHMDTNTAAGSASLVAKLFKGLRYDALNTSGASKDASGTLTYALMLSTLQCAGKYAIKSGEGFWVHSIASYFKMLGLTEFTGYNVFGPGAVALKGDLPYAIGHENYVSAQMREDMGPAGYNAASDNVHTALMFVNPRGWMIGDRKLNTVESERIVRSSQTVIVAKQRIDFQKMVPSTDKPAAILYNITTAA